MIRSQSPPRRLKLVILTSLIVLGGCQHSGSSSNVNFLRLANVSLPTVGGKLDGERQGRIALSRGDWQTAEIHLSTALDSRTKRNDTERAWLLIRHAQALGGLNRHDEALSEVDEALKLWRRNNPHENEAYLDMRISILLHARRWTEGIAEFRRLGLPEITPDMNIGKEGRSSLDFFKRGLAYEASGAPTRALNDFEASAQLAPGTESYVAAWLSRFLRFRPGRGANHLSVIQYTSALQNRDRLLHTIGLLHVRQKDVAGALNYMKASMEFGGPKRVTGYQFALRNEGRYKGGLTGRITAGLLDDLKSCLEAGCDIRHVDEL